MTRAGIAPGARKWWMLAAMSGVLGLVVLDETVVGVALVTIRADLAMSQVASHWVVNAYLLAFTCFVAVGGRLGDRLERRRVLVAGLALFAAASLVAGCAPGGAWLIGARALQGVGAALVFPACFAVMTRAFPAESRGHALGIQTTVAGLFMAAGPLVGGVFSETLSWRWIFWINLPVVAAIGAVAAAAWMPGLDTARGERRGERFDLPGLATLVAGLAALVVALMQGTEWGWTTVPTLALGAAGCVALAGFVAIELCRPDPLIDLGLLRLPSFTGGDLVFFAFQFDKIAIFVFVALYLQERRGIAPIMAGAIVLVAVLPSVVTSLVAGRLADRLGSRPPLLGGLLANGLAVLALALLAARGDGLALVVPLVVWGASLPLLAVPARRALMGAVPQDRHGQASGINLTIQMLGGTIGMALCGTVLAATGSYGLVFLVPAVAVLATLALAWRLVEWPG